MNLENRSIPVAVDRPARGDGRSPSASETEMSTQPDAFYTPPIDIHEGPDGLVLEADLPGANEHNLNIQLEDNVLSLHAHVQSQAPEGARTLYEEYRLGDYYR